MSDGTRYRITMRWIERPWWGLWMFERERCISMISPPGETRESAEGWRQMALATKGAISASLEVVE